MPDNEAMVETLVMGPNGGVPNHPHWPALIYRGAVSADMGVDAIAARYRANRWLGIWDWTVFGYHHFHPASHEALTVAAGRAVLHLGGPEGAEVSVTAGDAMILPAGFGHKLLSSEGGFTVVGSYPEGQEDREIIRADPDAAAAARDRIAATPMPATDPMFGADGPLFAHWS